MLFQGCPLQWSILCYDVSHVVTYAQSRGLYSGSAASTAVWSPVPGKEKLKLEKSPEFPMGVPKVGHRAEIIPAYQIMSADPIEGLS